MATKGFFGVENYFSTITGTFEYVFYPYSVYPVSILGIFWVYSDEIPILVQLSSTLWLIMVFFGVESYFSTITGTFEYVFYPYSVYSVCILGVFWVYSVGFPILVQLSSTLWRIWAFLGCGV